jgi:NADH-quinone oxidoreductase subunit G
VFRVRQGAEAPLDGVPGLSLRADRAANVRGAELLGFRRTETPLAGLANGDALLIADEELAGADAASLAAAVASAGAMVVIGTTLPPWASSAAVMLPVANMAEEEGTFTNVEGRVQRYLQAKAAPGLARPGYAAMGDLLTALGDQTVNFLPGDVFRALAGAHAAFGGMTYENLGLRGATVSAPPPAMAATT